MIWNLKDLVFLQRDSWRATHVLAQDGSQIYKSQIQAGAYQAQSKTESKHQCLVW